MNNLGRCVKSLKQCLGPENVLTRWSALHAYSSDASPYAVEPSAAAILRSPEQAVEAARICRTHGISLHPRGGGSGLAGGALGSGVVFDITGMDKILSIDISGRSVEVDTGILLDDLSARLAPLGFMFAPDPSSSDTCRIGGMLANNSSGPRSVKYGTTADHVKMIDVLLPDGARFEIEDVETCSDEFAELINRYHPFKVIYRILKSNAEKIRAGFPRLSKNSSGYNLLAMVELLDQGVFSLRRLFVGSEGTLGMFLRARLKLTPRPTSKVTLQILFDSIEEAGSSVNELLSVSPAALEIVDGSTLDLIGRGRFGIPTSAEAMLIMEIDEPPFDEKIELIGQLTSGFRLSCDILAETDVNRQTDLWSARRAIVPTLYMRPGRAKPFGFIEDIEVPIERVADMVKFADRLFKSEGLTAGIYGHIGDGNVHMRPVIDMSTPAGLKLVRKLYERVYDFVVDLGGSATAEHGDGRLRAQVLERTYGSEIYILFEKIRQELNPDRCMNPDIMISKSSFTENIDFEKVTRQCASCGKCNHRCPAFDIYGTEEMSARGWVRIMLTSQFSRNRTKHLIDGCLNCKNCYMICPAGVDVSKYVTERRSENKGYVARKIFDLLQNTERSEKWVGRFGKLNSLIDKPYMRPLADLVTRPIVHLDKDRVLPKFANPVLPERYTELVDNREAEVAYFYGCADKMLDLGSGPAAIELLGKAGFSVSLPTQHCCGMPQQTYGFFDHELEFARKNVDILSDYRYVVTTCATCLGELLHYKQLLKDDPEYESKAMELSSRCFDIAEFINEQTDLEYRKPRQRLRVAFHQPCHLREAGEQRVKATHDLIDSLPGVTLAPMPDADRCCGAAGTYNVFQYDNSMRIFARKSNGFQRSGADIVTSSCPTCVLQFIDGLKSPAKVKHIVELVNDLAR